MTKRRWHHLSSALSVCLFVTAMLILHHKLKGYRYDDFVVQLRSMRPVALLLAFGLTVLHYLALTAYDALALRYIKHRLSYPKLALASFIGYVFSNNATVVGGSAARYRIYSALGVSAAEVAKLVVFCGLTFWLGFFALGGVVFVVLAEHIPAGLHIPLVSVRPIGVLFLIAVALYLVPVIFKKTPWRIGNWEFPLPSFGLSAGQIAISSLDWLLAASVLYVLLPEPAAMSFPRFLSAFLLAQAAGLLSHVPGGLGVFETIILILFGESIEASSLVGTLLFYRLIYYLIPLFVAAILLALHEFIPRKITPNKALS